MRDCLAEVIGGDAPTRLKLQSASSVEQLCVSVLNLKSQTSSRSVGVVDRRQKRQLFAWSIASVHSCI